MNVRPVDRSKKSNIKCEHCKHWDRENLTSTAISSGSVCSICKRCGKRIMQDSQGNWFTYMKEGEAEC